MVAATGSAPLVVQWYEGGPGDTSRPVEGGSGFTFHTGVLERSTNSFWARVTNGCGADNTERATITVTPSRGRLVERR